MAKPKTAPVKMLTSLAGADHSYEHGAIVHVPRKTAEAWIEAGIAEAAPSEDVVTAERDGLAATVRQLEAELAERDARIAELEAVIAAAKPAA